MKELLLAIQARLQGEVTVLKYVDEDWGQLDYYSSMPPVQWPCCLIDIGAIAWKNLGQKKQQGTATITLYIADVKKTNTSSKAPATQRTQAWAIHDIIEQAHQALHTYLPLPNTSVLYRKTTARMKRDDGIQQYVIIYECVVTGGYNTGQGLSQSNLSIDIKRD
jgi:hypothetical protein